MIKYLLPVSQVLMLILASGCGLVYGTIEVISRRPYSATVCYVTSLAMCVVAAYIASWKLK